MAAVRSKRIVRHRPLSLRELQILELFAQGLGKHQIGAQLHIEELTVLSHMERIREALGVHSRPQAVAIVLRQGLIRYPSVICNEVKLTTRKCAILQYLADGYTNKEIGLHLYITENTVKTHLRLIGRNLGFAAEAQRELLVAVALREGWIE